jgi:ubiquinone/menaquinone biosynthesis C-methylase UbiE
MSVAQCSWSDVADGWDRWRDAIEEGDAGLTAAMLARAGELSGRAVLELAAGTGELAARLAERVGVDGSLLASDEAEGMVALLTDRLDGLANVEVTRVDACAIPAPDASYDVVVCRMGLMLMSDPAAAAGEMHRVLRPGGRLVVAVWAEPAANPWLASVGMAAMIQGLVPGDPPTGPGGPFSLGDPDALRGLVEAAGFGDVRVEPVVGVRHYISTEQHVDMGTSLAPPLHAALTRATPEQRAALHQTVRQLTSAYVADDGGLDLPTKAWVVSAAAGDSGPADRRRARPGR